MNIENIKAAISGINGIDDLLAEAGFTPESSIRHQLSIVRSMLTGLCVAPPDSPSNVGNKP